MVTRPSAVKVQGHTGGAGCPSQHPPQSFSPGCALSVTAAKVAKLTWSVENAAGTEGTSVPYRRDALMWQSTKHTDEVRSKAGRSRAG